ncbi:hypothetical protein H4R34_002790 [Dimargaris verticillata]|uniref:Uncharacterized protein n=1 Tax=Dimargaris verticillata TaxID=2761393 RepID=A0A9W8B8T6_9FUNG|nr:hypothetical protein H4R34_002790 [Dimargaris verticillata]
MARFIATLIAYVSLSGLMTSSISWAHPLQVEPVPAHAAVPDASPECQVYRHYLGQEAQALDERLKELDGADLEPLQKFKALLCLPPSDATLRYVGNFFANLDLANYAGFSMGPVSVANKRTGLQSPHLSAGEVTCAIPDQETPETMETLDSQRLLQCHPFVYGIQVGYDPVVDIFQEQIFDVSHDVYTVTSQYQQIATDVMVDAVKGAIALDDAQFVVSAYQKVVEEQEKGPYRNQYVMWALRFTPLDALSWARKLAKTEVIYALRQLLVDQKDGTALGRYWYQMFMA